MEAIPDSLAGEQTWPSDAELNGAISGTEAGTNEGAGRLRRNIPGEVVNCIYRRYI
jgi:hypothetical protein